MSVYLLPTFRSGAGHGSGSRCLSPLSYREKGRGMLFAPHHLIPPLSTPSHLTTSPFTPPLHILLHVSHSPVESVRREEGCISHPPFTPSPSHPLHISHPPFTPSPSHLTPSLYSFPLTPPSHLTPSLYSFPLTSHTLPLLLPPHTPFTFSHLPPSSPPQLCQSADLHPREYMSCKMHVLKASALKRGGLPSKPKLPRPLTSDQRSKLMTFFSKSGWS